MAFTPGIHSLALVLLVVAFVFLLLATISSPIVQSFKLASTSSMSFGVFGYCASDNCLKVLYPYTPSTLDSESTVWLISSLGRDTLAKILIAAPISLGLCFFTLIFALLAHFTGTLMLWAAFSTSVIALIGTILIAVSTILLFHPHVQWLGWLLIGAAVLLLFSMVTLLVSALSRLVGDEVDDGDVQLKHVFYDLEPKTGKNMLGASMDKISPDFLSFKAIDSSSSFGQGPNILESVLRYGSDSSVGPAGPTQPRPYASANRTNPIQHSATAQQPGVLPFGQRNMSESSSMGEARPGDVTNLKHYVYGDSRSMHQIGNAGPKLPESLTMPLQNRQPMPYVGNSSGSYTSWQPQVAPYPVSTGPFAATVFEHQPMVEGHRPFAEEYVEDDQAFKSMNRTDESDTDLEFTSVSQRPPNPNYMESNRMPQVSSGNLAPMNGLSLQPRYQYTPHGQSMRSNNGPQMRLGPAYPPQQRQPTLSETVLSSNPDIGVGSLSKRKISSGFVPVSRRMKHGLLPSELMGRR